MLFGKKEWHERSEFIDNVPDELIEVVKKEYPFGGRDDFGGGYGKFGGSYRKFGSKTFGGGAPIGAQQSDSFWFWQVQVE
jgi:hypothetical protein